MGRSIIIVHSLSYFSFFSLSLSYTFFLSRFRSLWATCMTVTMTASGVRLLLLALCVCRGSGLQQSAPRVRLSFKGELAKPRGASSERGSPPEFRVRFDPNWSGAAVFRTDPHVNAGLSRFLFRTYAEKALPAACQTGRLWEQKVDVTCGWVPLVPCDQVPLSTPCIQHALQSDLPLLFSFSCHT